MSQRWVIHVDMDAFFASCEQLTRPTLAGRPVLVGGRHSRSVVAGASYQARAYGARSAMAMSQARRLVGPSAVVVPPRMEVYSALSSEVMQVLASEDPCVEQVSIDEAFVEPEQLRGCDKQEVARWCEQLRDKIFTQVGLTASCGAGSGKQFAKICSDVAKPDGVTVVSAAELIDFMHPLSVRRLSGIGPVTARKLADNGIHTIGDLSRCLPHDARDIMGTAVGPFFLSIAAGIDDRPVKPRKESQQIGSERTFATDVQGSEAIAKEIGALSQRVFTRLQKDGRFATTVSIKIRTSDYTDYSRSRTTTVVHSAEDLYDRAIELVNLCEVHTPVRLLGVSLSGLTSTFQDLLFPLNENSLVDSNSSHTGRVPHMDDVALEEIDDDAQGEHRNIPGGVHLGTPPFGPGEGESVQVNEFRAGDDVFHAEFGHGWVQGSGPGVVSVRFETRSSGAGPVKSIHPKDPDLRYARNLDSLG